MMSDWHETMPAEFEPLAVYNAETTRGIVHTEEWRQRMADLQQRFDEWAARFRR
jgi:hypothetical protein